MKAKVTCCVVAEILLFTCVGTSQDPDVKVPAKATVDGNYSHLIRTIRVPDDEKAYGTFTDFGYYGGTEYAGYKDLKPGYWVYVAPTWYIWKNSKTPRGQVVTVGGPEAQNLVGRITGHVVFVRESDNIIALSLPGMQESVVRPMSDGEFYPIIHALSGPDSQGRLAYIEDHFFVRKEKDQKHLLKTIKLDGTADTEIFSRCGSAMWATTRAGNGEIGSHLALAPSGGTAALLSGLEEKQMPGALLSTGNIELWDVVKKTSLVVNTKALDQPMSWFPDGKRLAYVKLVPRNELPDAALGLDNFGQYGEQLWDEVPAVYVLDTVTGKSAFLHVGWTPVVSLDGGTVLVGGWDNRMEFSWRRVNVAEQQSTAVQWPGDAQGAIAVLTDNLVLYWGLPTTGAPVKYTKNNSRLRGPKLMLTLKVAMMNSTQFQTIVPQIDPRSVISFGQPLKRQ